MAPEGPGVLLDITRSLSRRHLAAPTGIDRVEAAWAAHLLGRPGALHFLARVPGGLVLLDRAAGAALLAGAEAADLRALLPLRPRPLRRAEAAARRLALGRAPEAGLGPLLARHLPPGTTALLLGHSDLAAGVMAGLGAAGCLRVAMIHDTIPLDHPGLSGPGAPARFAARLAAAARADLVVTAAEATAAAIRARLAALAPAPPPVEAVPFGAGPFPAPPPPAAMPGAPEPEAGPPAFVILGTVEPRKGHAFLLDLWAGLPLPPPRLEVIGRIGWNVAGTAARLRRGAPGIVFRGALPDGAARRILAGARALLLPSLAEGWGLPVAEALALGVPVVASDLPALREAGGGVPLFLPPRDAAAWRAAVLDLAEPGSAEHLRQSTLLKSWRATSWEAHFDGVLAIAARLRRNSLKMKRHEQSA